MRGEEAHIVDLRPATLLVPQQARLASEDGLETVESERCHVDQQYCAM